MKLWLMLATEAVVALVLGLAGCGQLAVGVTVGCSLALTFLLWPVVRP